MPENAANSADMQLFDDPHHLRGDLVDIGRLIRMPDWVANQTQESLDYYAKCMGDIMHNSEDDRARARALEVLNQLRRTDIDKHRLVLEAMQFNASQQPAAAGPRDVPAATADLSGYREELE